ncbi:hypothetical protein ARMSODRAFT_990448 [Armillaria solidipes]|uniref:Integrase zinc-binding domain-containing protein n=2 Tax=Armillaria solidipes TaxID=1076256 RepID=A0A2H3AV38_9AGAR|nr:hypothetical protein ARMSODRAFT_990448 [Armillaria solidipes]
MTTDQRMFQRNADKIPRLVILNPETRQRVLEEAHDRLGHKGEQAVYDVLRLRHVASCHECQHRKMMRMMKPPTISTPVTIFEKVYIDVMVMQPPSGKYEYIVCARDDLTGVLEASPLSKNNSHQLAKFFWEKIYCQYGAIVEHSHLILREAIVKACPKQRNGKIKNWHKYIDIAVFADRVTTSSVTGYTPYYLLHGVEPLLPMDLIEATFMVEGFQSGISTEELLALRIRQLSRHPDDLNHAAEMLKQARIQSQYKPGELVLVQNSRLEMTVNRFKTDPRYLGPYEVVRRTYGGAYKLRELDGTVISRSVAAFRLLPYVT